MWYRQYDQDGVEGCPRRSSPGHRALRLNADVATAKATSANLPSYLHLRPMTLLARTLPEEEKIMTWSCDRGKMRPQCLDKRRGPRMLHVDKHFSRQHIWSRKPVFGTCS